MCAPFQSSGSVATTASLATPRDTSLWLRVLGPFGQNFSGALAQNVQTRFPGQWTDASWEQASTARELLNEPATPTRTLSVGLTPKA